MLNRVIHTIKNKNMIKAGDNVICALSGGADSMALLYALYNLREKLSFSLYAAHLNHSIRGEEADSDMEFCINECKKLGVEIFTKRVDVPYLAQKRGISEELCGREERYAFFEEIIVSLGHGVVATGHHMNDRAETALFNLFRGSGSVKSIPYKRGYAIRPLLDIKRCDIENYLLKNGILWREDSTNKSYKYTRNNIRNVIIKDIEKSFPKAVDKICESVSVSEIDNEYLNLKAKESGAFCEGCILVDKFIPLHESMRRRVIIMALDFWQTEKNAESIKAVYDTILGKSGNGRDLPLGKRVEKKYNFVSVSENKTKLSLPYEQFVNFTENLEITAFDGIWSIKTVDKTEKMRDNKMMIILDADKMGGVVSIRGRRQGDYIYPIGLNGRKKLKEIFIDMKMPREKRDNISLLTSSEEVLFIPGIRKTCRYLPDEDTKKFFVAEFKPLT